MEKCDTVATPGVSGRRHGSDAKLLRCFSEQPSEPSARPPVANEPLRMSSFVTPLQSVDSFRETLDRWTQMWCGFRGAPRGGDGRHLLDNIFQVAKPLLMRKVLIVQVSTQVFFTA